MNRYHGGSSITFGNRPRVSPRGNAGRMVELKKLDERDDEPGGNDTII